jgi:hypothetical protein
VLSHLPRPASRVYIRELEKLQDDVDPIPTNDVVGIIESELHVEAQQAVRPFDEEPLGTASLGQGARRRASRRTTRCGQVQRAEHSKSVGRRHRVLPRARELSAEHTRRRRAVDMVGIVQQLERALADELDYRIEARNAADFRRTSPSFRAFSCRASSRLHDGARADDRAHSRIEARFDLAARRASSTTSIPSPTSSRARTSSRSRSTDTFTPIRIPGTCSSCMPTTTNPPTPSEVKASRPPRRPASRGDAARAHRERRAAQRGAATARRRRQTRIDRFRYDGAALSHACASTSCACCSTLPTTAGTTQPRR